MTSDDAILRMLDVLEELDVDYMVVGSLSSNVHGVARSTNDADFVVSFGMHSIRDIADRLGTDIQLDPQVSFESLTMTTRYQFRVVGSSFGIELFRLSDDAHDQERFQRRRRWQFMGREAYLPTPEDVIVMKARWAVLGRRDKDRADRRDLIAVQGDRLDWEYIYRWADVHDSRALLDELRRSVPE